MKNKIREIKMPRKFADMKDEETENRGGFEGVRPNIIGAAISGSICTVFSLVAHFSSDDKRSNTFTCLAVTTGVLAFGFLVRGFWEGYCPRRPTLSDLHSSMNSLDGLKSLDNTSIFDTLNTN